MSKVYRMWIEMSSMCIALWLQKNAQIIHPRYLNSMNVPRIADTIALGDPAETRSGPLSYTCCFSFDVACDGRNVEDA